MIRSAEFELSLNNSAVMRQVKEETEEILRAEADKLEKELDYSVIPIKNLVGIQLSCGLSVLEKLKSL